MALYFINAFFEVDKVEPDTDSARELKRAGNLFPTLEMAKEVQKAIHDTLHRQQ